MVFKEYICSDCGNITNKPINKCLCGCYCIELLEDGRSTK